LLALGDVWRIFLLSSDAENVTITQKLSHHFMKQISNVVATAGFLLVLSFSNTAPAQNLPVVHWINDLGQDAASVLSSDAVFITSFKTNNDVKVTPLTSDPVSLYVDAFGGSSPGNNPWYLTQFVGVTTNGTGDGVAGDIQDLNMTGDSTGSLQFDFQSPLTSHDRILLIDVDGSEQYLLQAYVFNGSSYDQVSLAGWIPQSFSGQMGGLPDSSWPVWDPTAGTLTSGTSGNLNEELFVLTPDRNIDRLVITKVSGYGWSTTIQFFSLSAVSLTIQQTGTNVVLSWPLEFNSMVLSNLVVYASDNLIMTNNWVSVSNEPVASGGSWVLTNAASGQEMFYRLQGP